MGTYKNRGSLVYQVQQQLHAKLRISESKKEAKKDGTYKQKIFNWSTYKTYQKHSNYFTAWAKETHDCRTLEQCKPYVSEWLQNRIDSGLSASTIKTDASSLAKLYNCSTKDFNINTPARLRSEITRSREEVKRDKHFSAKNNKELINFARGTGLRRGELEQLKGQKLVWKGQKPYVVVDVNTKGGRHRESPIIGTQEQIRSIVNKIENTAPDQKVWGKVHSGADIHSYRREYAQNYYNNIARPIEQIPYDRTNKGSGHKYQSQVYSCRSDLKGTKYDKIAMKEVSLALGHSRIDIIAQHYLN